VHWSRPWVFSVALLFWASSASGVPSGGKGDDSGSPQDASETLRYEWVSNGKRVGELTWTQGPSGRSIVVSSMARGDRAHELREEFQFAADRDGSFFQVSGTVGGEPVSEVLKPNPDRSAVGAGASANESVLELPAIYVPESGTPISWSMVVSRVAQSPRGRRSLLPSGVLSVTEREALRLGGGRRGEDVSLRLFTIVGLGFEPSYLWFDDAGDLFARVGPEASLVRRGHKDLLPRLESVQERVSGSYWHEVAERSIHALAGPLLIQDVRVFDSLTGKLSAAQDVLVQDGLIGALSAEGEFAPPPNASTVEGQGKVLMPGLWDMHGHVYESGGVMNLAAGVTHVRDLGNTPAIVGRRQAFASGELVGPHLHLSGFLDRKSKYSSSVVGQSVRTLRGALAAVDDYAKAGYEQIKLYASIDPDWIRPIAEAAHARGLRVTGHVPAFTTATRAVEDGYDEIAHMTMVLLQFVVDPSEDTRTRIRFTAVGDRAGTLDLDGPEVTSFLDLLVEKGTVIDPTLAGYVAMFVQEQDELDPRYAGVGDHLPPDVYRMLLQPGLAIDDSNREAYRASADAMLRLARKMHERGIVLVPGTDDYPGLTLLADLAMWVEAEIPNAEVLQMATHGSAKVTGVGDQEGVIRSGARADLILIDGDPTTSIRDLQRVQLVVRGETYLLPSELYEALGMVPFAPAVKPRSPDSAPTE
jgi:hypothetical protein